MLLKKNKKSLIFKLLVGLLLVIALAVFLGACGDDPVITTTSGASTKDDTPRDTNTPNNVGDTEDEDTEDEDNEEPEVFFNYRAGSDALSWGSEFTPLTLGLQPGNDTTEIRLNWYSAGAAAGKTASVRFVKGTFENGNSLIEETGAASSASSGNTQHKVEVTGLKPGASYQYSVSTDGTNWSPAYSYIVPATTGAFKFAVIADSQLTQGVVDKDSRYPATTATTRVGWLETMEIIGTKGVSFIVSAGDQVDASSGNENEYTNLFAPQELRNLPLAPTAGNHDNHLHYNYHFNWPNAQMFDNETTGTTQGRNYFYKYNNILFVHLNTAPGPSSKSTAEASITRFNQTLTNAKTAHQEYDWLIVVHHKSTASVADHCADRDIQYYVEAGFERVMSEHNVDFVLAGHDHVYARSYPLQGKDNGLVSVPDTTKGGNNISNPGNPIYLTFTTASGLKYYAVSADPFYTYTNTLYVKNNSAYPYLGMNPTTFEPTLMGSVPYMNDKLLPVSNAVYVQPYIPSYTVVEVNGKTITFKTYPIAGGSYPDVTGSGKPDLVLSKDTPYDTVTVTKN